MAKNCVNKESEEFKVLQAALEMKPVILAAKVSIWQTKNSLDKFPTVEDIESSIDDGSLSNAKVLEEKYGKETSDHIMKTYSNSQIENLIEYGHPEEPPVMIQNPIIKFVKPFKKPLYRNSKVPTDSQFLIRNIQGKTTKAYIPGYPVGSNKRRIADRYFRYAEYGPRGEVSPPMYPFSIYGVQHLDKKLASYINSGYDIDVVRVRPDGAIIFTENAEDAIYKGENGVEHMDLPIDESDTSKETDESKKKEEEAKFESISDFLENYKPETKEDEHIIETIKRLNDRKRALNAKLKKDNSDPQIKASIEYLSAQINTLTEKLKKLEGDDTILEEMASKDAIIIQKQLNEINDNYNSKDKLSGNQLLEMMDRLVTISHNIKGWADIQDIVTKKDDKLKDKLRYVHGTYSDLNKMYNELVTGLFVEYANQFSHRNDWTKEEITASIEDISGFKANYHSLVEANVPLLQIVGTIIDRASNKANSESSKKKSQLKKWEKKLTKAGHTVDSINKMFQQMHNGKWTGNIIGKFSHDFYVKKSELWNNFAKSKKTSDFNKYKKWIETNTKSLHNKKVGRKHILIAISEGSYDEALKLGYSKDELDLQKAFMDEYFERKSAYEEYAKALFTSMEGDLDLSALNEDLNKWSKKHSPFQAYTRGNDGHKFIINPRPIDSWQDSAFSKIENNELLNGFYNFIKERFDENNKHLGYFNHFNEFYLPEVEKNSLNEFMQEKGLTKKSSFLWNSMKKAISQTINPTFDRAMVHGKDAGSVPVYMMSNRIPPDMKESNIFTVLNNHTEASLAHAYKTKIKPVSDVASRLLDEINEIKGEQQVPGLLVNAKKLLQYNSEVFFYDKRKSVDGKIKKIKTTEKILDRKTGDIVEKEVVREVTVSAIGDSLISYTYLKSMSFTNLVTPAVNTFFGMNSNLIYASAGEDVDSENMRKSLLHMMSATTRSFDWDQGKKSDFVNKVFAFMEESKLLGQIHDSEYGNRKSLAEKITFLQEKAEHYNQGSLMLGVLYTNKVLNKNGKEVSLFDAYKVGENGLEWNTELMGEQSKADNNRVISEDKKGVDLNNLTNYLNAVNKRVHGDYKSPMLAKKSVWARFAMLYKTWMPQAIKVRFGNEDVDIYLPNKEGELGREIKGRYLSMIKSRSKDGIDLKVNETLGIVLKGIVSKKALNGLSEVDRVNLIRNITELKHTAGIIIAMLLLKGMFMDDDDEFNPLLNLTVNMLSKTSADLSAFVNPNSFGALADNLVPVASSLRDIQRVFSSAGQLLTGEGYYEAGPYKDMPKLLINLGRSTPIVSGGIKTWNLASKTYLQH